MRRMKNFNRMEGSLVYENKLLPGTICNIKQTDYDINLANPMNQGTMV